MRLRTLLCLLAMAALPVFVAVSAQESNKTRPSESRGSEIRDDAALEELKLLRQFKEFQEQVLKLKQRLERSPRPEDRERAVTLQKVLEKAQDSSISTQFERVVEFLKKDNLSNIGDIKLAAEQTRKLADDLRELVALLREDSRTRKLQDESARLKDIIQQIDRAILQQRQVQGQTQVGKTDPKELNANQNQVSKSIDKIAKAIDKKGGGDAGNDKSTPKEGEKDGADAGESKNQGKEESKGSPKDSGDKSSDKQGQAKGGDSKAGDPKGADPKGGDPKAGDPKGGDPKGGSPKGGDPKGGDPKGGSPKGGDPKGGDPKGGSPKGGDPKGGDPKGGSPKGGDPKGGDPKQAEKNPVREKAEAKNGPKEGENKAGAKDSKSGEKQAAAPKNSGEDSKRGESKPGEKSDGQSQAKGGGEPKDGSPQPGGKSDNAKQPPPSGSKEPQVGKKQIKDAQDNSNQAENDLAKKDNKKAGDDQSKVIDNLEKAKKKLEDLLRQMREEELERLLAALQGRLERMLAMQIDVHSGTEQVARAVEKQPEKKAARENQIESARLSDKEKEIVNEATKAMELLEAEGSAVAFPEVFQQVREDMKHVQRRLDITDVGPVTQAIEKDIIDTLKEMIEALKKARKELDDKKSPPPGEQKAQQPQDQKLLEQIAELKMIRSMQLRVNARTQVYGKMYQGEQAIEPHVRREIFGLAERQERIFEVTNRIAKGDNK